jgi:hypothetical protein
MGGRANRGVLEPLLCGASIREVARRRRPSRRTVGRWWRWLEARFDAHGLHLRSRFADLGRAVDWKGFWSRCLERVSLGAKSQIIWTRPWQIRSTRQDQAGYVIVG